MCSVTNYHSSGLGYVMNKHTLHVDYNVIMYSTVTLKNLLIPEKIVGAEFTEGSDKIVD